MSFILDALRKSETERQHKGSAEFANVPTSNSRREGPPAWLWVLGGLLLINLAVLIGILLRPNVAAPERANQSSPITEARQEVERREDFASRVEAAREKAPATEETATARIEQMPTETTPADDMQVSSPNPVPTAVRPAALAAGPAAAVPTIHQVQAQGLITLPDLHVDIHVYSEAPRDRFVFINMNKQREGTRLPEGPLVEEITPDGVVLSMNGITFLLPRD